ncbi:MAG: quinol dehydrogenase, partial [Betaproteobacteria bacterium]|nr:quinol dehydrogenase [Betaproteobacteria bacterium]
VLEGWAVFLAVLLPPGMILLVEGISGRRLWCSYICPQSVCLAVAAQCLPGGFGIKWAPERCACPHDDRLCQRVCSLGLIPNRKGGPPRNECSQCAQCVSACEKRGAALRIGL